MEPNKERYKVTRAAFTVGAVAAVVLRFATGDNTIPIIILVASLVIGVIVDLVIRKA